MRRSQQTLVKISETRERVNRLMAKPTGELTEEERAALDADTDALLELEREYRTAVAEEAAADAEADAQRARDGEGGELRQLQERVRVGRYMTAAVQDRRLDGAEAEFNEARGIADTGIVQLPFELLAPAEVRTEHRADAPVNIGPTMSDPLRPGRWLSRLFSPTRAGYLGITTESVASGAVEHYIFASSNAAVMRARGEAVDAVAATVTALQMKPKRMAGRYVYRVEDAAQMDRLEPGLRNDLAMVMSLGMDFKIFQGDTGASGTDADIAGLVADAGVHPLSPVVSRDQHGVVFEKMLDALASLIDGVRAAGPGDVQTLVGLGLNIELLTRQFIATEVDSMGEVLRRRGFDYQTATTDQLGTGSDTTPIPDGQLVAFGSLARYREGAAVAAVWPSVSLIRDPYTGAAKGEVAVTATALWDFKIIRANQFFKLTLNT